MDLRLNISGSKYYMIPTLHSYQNLFVAASSDLFLL